MGEDLFSKKPLPLPLKVLLVVGIVFLLSGVLFFARGKRSLIGGLDGWLADNPSSSSRKNLVLETQTGSEGDVTVEVTPKGITSAGIDFDVKFTTHSVDLDFNLVERSSLVSASGEKLKPISWDGGQGGHHLSGRLKFPPFSRELKSMRLVLTDNLLVKERAFEWTF
jgi:hypothetical protein